MKNIFRLCLFLLCLLSSVVCPLASAQQTTLLYDVGDNTLKRPTAAQFRAANLDASYQPLDADLTSWSLIPRASGFDTFTATPSGANLASLLTTALPASKGGTGLTALSANVVTLLGAADYSAFRTSLSLVVGTNVQAYDADLASIAANTTGGFLTRTAADTYAARTLTPPASGLAIFNGNGVAANPTFSLTDDLAALEGLSGTGIPVRTNTSAWTTRTIGGTAGQITVTNGDGVAGAPTISLPSTITQATTFSHASGLSIAPGASVPIITLSDSRTIAGSGQALLSLNVSDQSWSARNASGDFAVRDDTAAAYYLTITRATGVANFLSATASTSTTTGSATFAGGIGVAGTGYFGGNLVSTGGSVEVLRTGAVDAFMRISADAGRSRNLSFNTGTARRWVLGTNAVAESGSNAGTSFTLTAYTDADAAIDTPLTILRAAGGLATLARPLSISSTTASTSTTTGALTVAGGVGVAGSGYFGAATGGSLLDVSQYVYAGTRTATSGQGGALRLRNDTAVQSWLVGHLTAGADTKFHVYDLVNSLDLFTITPSTGVVSLASTTEATSAGAGSLTTAGGIYAAKRVVTSTSYVAGVQTFTGAGAASSNVGISAITSSGVAQAVTLADGVNGQIKTIIHEVDGGSIVVTPTTKTGFTSFTLTNVGESVTLVFLTTRGWMITANYGATITP